MPAHLEPLTWATVAQTWRFDVSTAIIVALLTIGYGRCAARARLRGQPVESGRAWCYGIGMGLWLLASMSVIGVYAHLLFWVRALQVVLLLLVVPFLIAAGKPLTMLRNALGQAGQDRFDRLLATRLARVLAYPLTTSVAMLATPWLLYLTPWYTASLQHGLIDAATRMLLVLVGFGYFYSRLQADPVPRRFSQLISLIISIAETIGDGVLGLVIWQGPLIAAAYYVALHRSWGPDPRLDQTIGAGVLWILGDLLGVPFVVVLMRALSSDDKAHAKAVDEELDRREQDRREQADAEQADAEQPAQSTLWWENDPQLRERFGRR
ncbi:MAG: cytochrome c oxidase assembly protein [Mycobacteriaceae bacterium]|nr:cytochrome c oxidase assembly protein [Mycobacteriaceae bacterium]